MIGLWGVARDLVWRIGSYNLTGTEHSYGWNWCGWFC